MIQHNKGTRNTANQRILFTGNKKSQIKDGAFITKFDIGFNFPIIERNGGEA